MALPLLKYKPTTQNFRVRSFGSRDPANEYENTPYIYRIEDFPTSIESLLRVAYCQVARLERSGQISVIPAAREPQVIEVKVEQGVQTVRVKLDYPAEGERY